MPPSATSASDTTPQNTVQNLRGIALIALGFFSFSACDMQAKLLTADLPALEIVWFRQLGLFLGVIVLIAWRGPGLLASQKPLLQIGRGLTAAGSAVCFVIGVRVVPLADAVAVTFIAPFIVTVMGALLLREPVGPRRWAAVAFGFLGMLIVIRPGLGVFDPAIIFVVFAAFLFSVRQILSRWLSNADSVLTTVAYTSITSGLALSIALPFVWTTPERLDTWALIVGVALTAAAGEILVITALSIAEVSALAPVHYSLILWGTLYGYMIFGHLPDLWTVFGCIIIVASGLYAINRERLRQRGA
ncbi:MAG: DMT family transporter [Pseudomonadota bacterium]